MAVWGLRGRALHPEAYLDTGHAGNLFHASFIPGSNDRTLLTCAQVWPRGTGWFSVRPRHPDLRKTLWRRGRTAKCACTT